MSGDECSAAEDVLRAIRHADWDEKKRGWSSDLFKGRRTSLSRPSILRYQQIVEIFRSDFDGRPTGPLVAVGEINVGKLQAIGACYEPKPTQITVKPEPIEGNLA